MTAAVLLLAASLSPLGAAVQRQPSAAPVVDALAVQVRLDRAGVSPGEIDGRMGTNTRRALDAFAKARQVRGSLRDVLAALAREQNVPAKARYRIADADVAGPFVAEIPEDLEQQALLPSLGYRNALEALAERLHATPALLRRLNPSATFKGGEEIDAPNILVPAPPPAGSPALVRVSKASSSLRLEDESGTLLFYAPVTTGSEHDPLPLGDWKVTAILWQPEFHYNPELFWDGDPTHSKATIPSGPNNPVGVVWIDIDRPHYGLHGTPEPSNVGKTASHGCVRLTNWDAARVATAVRPGLRVVFEP
jgi:lipoprotein-anchoring transpeptidase ErfK/SrfK